MSYVLRIDGKKQSSGFTRLQSAILSGETAEGGVVEVVDEAQDGDRVVWTKKGGTSNEPQ